MVDKSKIKWQCVRCGTITTGSRPDDCNKCNGTMFRNVTHDKPDDIDPKVIEHLTKKMTECLECGEPLKLEEEQNRTIEAGTRYVQIKQLCSNCGHQYKQQWIPESRKDLLEELGIKDVERIPWL